MTERQTCCYVHENGSGKLPYGCKMPATFEITDYQVPAVNATTYACAQHVAQLVGVGGCSVYWLRQEAASEGKKVLVHDLFKHKITHTEYVVTDAYIATKDTAWHPAVTGMHVVRIQRADDNHPMQITLTELVTDFDPVYVDESETRQVTEGCDQDIASECDQDSASECASRDDLGYSQPDSTYQLVEYARLLQNDTYVMRNDREHARVSRVYEEIERRIGLRE